MFGGAQFRCFLEIFFASVKCHQSGELFFFFVFWFLVNGIHQATCQWFFSGSHKRW